MSECCSDKNEGLFYSVFWIFNMGSLVVGNLIAALVIEHVSESTFYYILTVICFVTIAWFTLLPKPKIIIKEKENENEISFEEEEI